jgi:hypothetical protein
MIDPNFKQKKIFLSYVRADSEADTGRLVDTLKRDLHDAKLFIDVDNIEYGANWKRVIERAIEDSAIILCAMGPDWKLSPAISLELSIALKSNIPVVPVLFRDADLIVLTDGLESEIAELRDRNAISINHNTWHRDITPLIDFLKKVLSDPARARVIIDPPNPESLLEFNPSSSFNIKILVNYAQDLSECLADEDLFAKAKEAAVNFDTELKKKQEYDLDMRNSGFFYRNIRAPEPKLMQIIEGAKSRLKIEMDIRQLLNQSWTPVQYQKAAQYLNDKNLLSKLTALQKEFTFNIKDYKEGGMTSSDEIREAKAELDKAIYAAKERLSAELPGITKRYPERKWP